MHGFDVARFVYHFAALCVALPALSSALAGCGGDQVCSPGATQECVCPTGKSAAQVCREDGSGWKSCRCSSSDTGPASDARDATDTLDADTSDPVSCPGIVDTGDVGTKSCGRIYWCIEEKTCSDEACRRSCVRQGSCRARKAYQSVERCVERRCGADASLTSLCALEKCEGKLRACRGSGHRSCRSYLNCRRACRFKVKSNEGPVTMNESKFEQCIESNCGRLSVPGKRKKKRLFKCTRDNCSGVQNSGKCSLRKCETELLECGLTGNNASCAETTNRYCRQRCLTGTGTPNQVTQNEARCFADCRRSGTLQSRMERAVLADCATQANENCVSCKVNQCESEMRTCGTLGTKPSCKDQFECYFSALNDGDGGGAVKCIYEADAEPRKELPDVTKCFHHNCRSFSTKQQVESCMLNNCGQEWQRCRSSQ